MSEYKQEYHTDEKCPVCGGIMVRLMNGVSPHCGELGCSNKYDWIKEAEQLNVNCSIARALGYNVNNYGMSGADIWKEKHPNGSAKFAVFGGSRKEFNEKFANWLKDLPYEDLETVIKNALEGAC